MKCNKGHEMVRAVSGKMYCRVCKINTRKNPSRLSVPKRYKRSTKLERSINRMQSLLLGAGYSQAAARALAIALLK